MLLFNLSKVSLESINSTAGNLFLGRKRNQTHQVALYDDVHDSVGYWETKNITVLQYKFS